jgi:ubiquinone/menaquinone biosynthesis C-methylase UbiE
MMPMMRMPAEAIAGLLQADGGQPWKVLDIAAGHGVFGITIARHNPKAEIVALDWPKVLEVAQENAEAAGVAARYSRKPGSAFDVEFGSGYDAVLLTNFLHHFDMPTCEGLLRKVHKALKAGGRVVILEFVPNEDRVTPPRQASFAMLMLTGTPGGDAYTWSEYQAMLRNTGFVASEIHPLPPTPQTVMLATKK